MPVLSNAKYELFCRQLALGKTASEAYELAGYKPSRSNASVLRAKQNICDRLAEILQESGKTVLKQIEYTRDVLLSELEEARQLALRLRQASAAVAATMGKARILGLIIDRREVGDVGAFDNMTTRSCSTKPGSALLRSVCRLRSLTASLPLCSRRARTWSLANLLRYWRSPHQLTSWRS